MIPTTGFINSHVYAPVADELPEWEQISTKRERGEALTPLELFVYDNEPADGDAWRDQLAVALASALAAKAVKPSAVAFANAVLARYGNPLLPVADPAPQASKAVRILFPTHLRKMWSGGEVQAWLDEHQGVTAPTPSAKGSLERYRRWQPEQASQAQCSCPSGDRSLRWPCAKHRTHSENDS